MVPGFFANHDSTARATTCCSDSHAELAIVDDSPNGEDDHRRENAEHDEDDQQLHEGEAGIGGALGWISWGVLIVRFLPHPTESVGDGPIIGTRAVSYKHRWVKSSARDRRRE